MFLLGWLSFLRKAWSCYSWADWSGISFFLVLLKEVRTWGEDKISSFLFLALSVEWGSAVKLKLFLILKSKQINQPSKSFRHKKSGKLINYPSTTNSIILLPLFAINKIFCWCSVFYTTFHYPLSYILSCHFHMPHSYICFLVGQSTWSGDITPGLVFRVLLFRVMLFSPIKRFRKLVFQI